MNLKEIKKICLQPPRLLNYEVEDFPELNKVINLVFNYVPINLLNKRWLHKLILELIQTIQIKSCDCSWLDEKCKH